MTMNQLRDNLANRLYRAGLALLRGSDRIAKDGDTTQVVSALDRTIGMSR